MTDGEADKERPRRKKGGGAGEETRGRRRGRAEGGPREGRGRGERATAAALLFSGTRGCLGSLEILARPDSRDPVLPPRI